MPLVTVIRGDQLSPAALNVRTPTLRVPLWAVLAWQLLRGLALLIVVTCKFWYLTAPTAVLVWLYLRFGWAGPSALIGTLIGVGGVWWFEDRASFRRFGWWPVLARWRRMGYRRSWHAAMATARLAVTFDGRTVLPLLRSVRCTPGGEVISVRMVSGQIPDDYANASERLAHTFGVRQVKATPGPRPDLVTLTLLRGDPLTTTVPPLPVPAAPDFTALPVARQEDGEVFGLRLYGTQVLVVGATGSGKGSVIWSLVHALAPGVSSGLVRLWGIDPKGGMELGIGRPMFARFAATDPAAMADLLDDAAAEAQRRAARLAGTTRQHLATVDEPLIVLVIDELANLTAYLTDRQLKERIKAALGVVLSQGRAVGVHVVAAIQDPRKEVLPARGLFPTRIGLRLSEPGEVDMVLGDGMRDRGALCDRVRTDQPGVGFVVLDGDPSPMRVRFSYLDDDTIRAMAAEHGRLRAVEAGTTTGRAA